MFFTMYNEEIKNIQDFDIVKVIICTVTCKGIRNNFFLHDMLMKSKFKTFLL